MRTKYRVTIAAATIGIAALSGSAHAGNGSAVGAGLLGFGVGAVVGSALAPKRLRRSAAAGLLRAAATCLRRAACLRRTRLRWAGVLRASVSRSSTLATSNRSSVLE